MDWAFVLQAFGRSRTITIIETENGKGVYIQAIKNKNFEFGEEELLALCSKKEIYDNMLLKWQEIILYRKKKYSSNRQ